ncbi:MAG: hypothetical protein FD138_487 [Planctomycetota bacterium]|nr:MAG: hypothetical protein FD138_487 [Planctomycetota bacterium]
MADPRLNLKNPNVAAVLAFLIPGAGHWYQGRCFKAAIYSVCILSTFFWGQAMAEWKGVYFRWQDLEGRTRFRTKDRTIGYLSQVLVGLPSLPALIQWQRYSSGNDAENRDFTQLEAPIDAEFRGYAKSEALDDSWEGMVTGQIQLSMDEAGGRGFGPEVRGHFRGRLEGDAPREVEFELGGLQGIAPKILGDGNVAITIDGKSRPKEYSSSRRSLRCRIMAPRGEFEAPVGELEGTIPRAFTDWYQVPLEEDAIQEMNRRLGRRYEIALLFTWVAGLLNLLAIWDAYEGPAYGYGDEVDQPDGQPSISPSAATNPAPVAVTTSATPAPTS